MVHHHCGTFNLDSSENHGGVVRVEGDPGSIRNDRKRSDALIGRGA
jgi:hypothetical protein